jgi:hypothetical protein
MEKYFLTLPKKELPSPEKMTIFIPGFSLRPSAELSIRETGIYGSQCKVHNRPAKQ